MTMNAVLTLILHSLASIACIMAAFPDDADTIVGKGCKNRLVFNTTFLTASGDICTDCKFCSGSREAYLFDSSVEDVCTECISADADCDTLEIVTSFDESWTPTFFHLVSAAVNSTEDPSQVTMLGSKDKKDWVTLFTIDDKSSPLPLFPARRTRETFSVFNSEEFKHLSLRLKRKNASTHMNIGTYGVLQDYLKQCSTDLFNDIVGFNPTDIVPTKGNKITTIAKPSNQFIVSYKLYLKGKLNERGSVLRITATDNDCCAWPDRWLFMDIQASGRLTFSVGSTSNGNNYIRDGFPIQFQKWHDIKVETIGNKIKLFINGVEKGSKPNENRPQLDKVDVFVGDNFHVGANAVVRDYKFIPL